MKKIIKPFFCEREFYFCMEKSLLRVEWEMWLRTFEIYLIAGEIDTPYVREVNYYISVGHNLKLWHSCYLKLS